MSAQAADTAGGVGVAAGSNSSGSWAEQPLAGFRDRFRPASRLIISAAPGAPEPRRIRRRSLDCIAIEVAPQLGHTEKLRPVNGVAHDREIDNCAHGN